MKPVHALTSYVRSSLSRKFVLAAVLVNLVVMTALGVELLDRERAALDGDRISRAGSMANLLAESADRHLAAGNYGEVLQLARAAAAQDFVNHVTFEDAGGRVVANTAPAAAAAALTDEFKRGPAAHGRALRLVTRSEQAFTAAAPVLHDGTIVGWVQISVSRDDIVRSQREMGFFALLYGVAIVLLVGFVAFLTARSITGRLSNLTEVAKRFRNGDRSVRALHTGTDEVGSVARGLNAMLENIAETERSLNDAFRVAQLGSWRYIPSASRLQWSETVHQIFGLDPSEPAPAPDAFLKALPAEPRKKLLRLLHSGEVADTVSFNVPLTRSNGSHAICWIEARSELCPHTGERILVGVCQEVTEREAAAAQLRQAQKMEAVGQLTGGLAHDFNNLLAIIIGNLDLLEEPLQKVAGARECVDEALAAALRGSELTRQLLAFSRRQPLSPQRVDLNRLIEDMSPLWRRTLGEAIEVRIHPTENPWTTRVDPSQLESAVLNLVINARDAMPDGGTLTVETSNLSRTGEDWSDGENGIPPGDYSVVSVSDTGTGMSPEVAAQVFEPFFTTKAVGEGTGLGLSMIYGFAKQSGGLVRIYSEIGLGTTVRLFLPCDRSAAAVAEAKPQGKVPLASNETVLLVEDNDGVRRVAARQLEELGYSVIEARDGPAALAFLEGHRVDLLFTDIVMPGGLNGFELAVAAKQRHPRLKVLHTSGFTRPVAEELSNMPEPHALLSKPYRKVDLAVRLRKVLDAPPTAAPSDPEAEPAISSVR